MPLIKCVTVHSIQTKFVYRFHIGSENAKNELFSAFDGNANGIYSCFRFFLQEIQAGEALISSGDIEQGVTHLANAVVVCGQPTQLLQVRHAY